MSSSRATPQTKRFSYPTAYQLVGPLVARKGRSESLAKRSLVLDYLTHQCYTKTARTFLRDSAVRHFNADGDEVELPLSSTVDTALHSKVLKEADLRQEIRTCILSGRIDDATELLNEHFPRVLSSEEGGSKLRLGDGVGSWSDAYHTTRKDYIAPHSLDPAHISLNLRIQAFVEMCRTRNRESSEAMSGVSKDQQTSVKDAGNGAELHWIALLSKAQKLYALVNMLPDPSDRQQYHEELKNVAGLLAYKEPERGSSSKYMSQERREAVAEQIDSAVLNASDSSVTSTLELVARQVTVAWAGAHEWDITPQPGAVLPPAKDPAFQVKKSDGSEAVPPFDLVVFLDAKLPTKNTSVV